MASKAARANISSAIGAVSVLVPIRDKSAGWIVKSRPVNYYPGETAEDAESFGAEIFASLRALRDRRTAELAQPVEPVTTVCRERVQLPGAYQWQPAEHVACEHSRGQSHDVGKVYSQADRDSLAALAARHAARKGSAPVPQPEPVKPAPVRKPRAVKAEPVQVIVDSVIVATVEHHDLTETAPDAMTLCNACELRPMVGPEHPGYAAGYCAECYQDAETPEPVGPIEIAAAAARVEPEPAPVLTVIQPATRPTCERCGQVFRLHGTGAEWHRANRPDCAIGRLSVVA